MIFFLKNYSISELEALAVIWSLQYLRHLVYGKPITIITDHHALCWLKSIKDLTGRLARWAIKLAEFDYEIFYKNGKAHTDADYLSRHPATEATQEDEDEAEEIPTYLVETTQLEDMQRDDPDVMEIINAIINPNDPTIGIGLGRRAKNYKLIDNILYKKNASPAGSENLLVVPKTLIPEILFSHHSEPLAGHLGITKTLHRIKTRYYWDKLQKDVEKFVKGCPDCQARKGRSNVKPAGLLQPISVGLPFEKIGIDLLGPFRKSKNGKVMIVVATDYATRWAETKALPNGKAEHVAKFILENIICSHGSPRIILSDRGTVFMSEMVTELMKIMGVVSRFTTAYHPQCNGLTERFNKTLAEMLSIFTAADQTDWDVFLPHVTFAYNTSIQDTTQFSPFMLVHGREAILPTEANLGRQTDSETVDKIREKALRVRSLAVENIKSKQKYDKTRFDAKHRHLDFEPGEKVKVFTPVRKVGRSEKLLLRWFGPYYVLRKVGEVDYEISKGKPPNAKTDIVHVSRILPYFEEWTPTPITTGKN